MKDFYIEYDANKKDSGFSPQSDTIYNVVLAANVMETITVPDGAAVVLFSADGDFWCRFHSNVAVPAADVLDGSGGELNPDKRVVRGVSEIKLIADAPRKISLSFYNIPRPTGITHWG